MKSTTSRNRYPNKRRSPTNDYMHFNSDNESSPSIGSPLTIIRPSKPSKFATLMKNIFILGITSLILMILFYLIVINKEFDIRYCKKSDDLDSNKNQCIQCPNGEICIDGILQCGDGYTNILGICSLKNFESLNENRLYIKMAQYIASKVDDSCSKSPSISMKELNIVFPQKDNKISGTALTRLEILGPRTIYSIKKDGDNFTSYRPILNAKCKVKVYAYRHITTIFLLATFIILTLILVHIILKKQSIQRDIKNCSRNIMADIKKNKKGDFKYSSDFALSDSNPLSKYWDRIVNEIEKNPSITILNGVKGKLWGHV